MGSIPVGVTKNKNTLSLDRVFLFLIKNKGIEKEGAKFRAGQEPAETQVKTVQWTVFLTRLEEDSRREY